MQNTNLYRFRILLQNQNLNLHIYNYTALSFSFVVLSLLKFKGIKLLWSRSSGVLICFLGGCMHNNIHH